MAQQAAYTGTGRRKDSVARNVSSISCGALLALN